VVILVLPRDREPPKPPQEDDTVEVTSERRLHSPGAKRAIRVNRLRGQPKD